MKYYGAKRKNDYGFYEENFENAIEITDEYWMELLKKQNEGKIIILYENNVIAVNDYEYELNSENKWVKLTETEMKTRQLSIQNAIRTQEIQNELDMLDRKRIRAIAEPSLKDENTTWLEFYNSQISELREELSKIS